MRFVFRIMDVNEEAASARHEAAHAVAAYALDVDFDYVTLEDGGCGIGAYEQLSYTGRLAEDVVALQDRYVIALVGLVMDGLDGLRGGRLLATRDQHVLQALSNMPPPGLDPSEIAGLLRGAARRARVIPQTHQRHLNALPTLLASAPNKRLTGGEVRGFFREAFD